MSGSDLLALLDQMSNGVEMVMVGVYGRLREPFKRKYGEERGAKLAAAVLNELFSRPPSRADARDFLDANKALVVQEIVNLRENQEIREAVTDAVRVQMIVAQATGGVTEDSLRPVDKLIAFGLLVTTRETPSPDTFLPMAQAFYRSDLQQKSSAGPPAVAPRRRTNHEPPALCGIGDGGIIVTPTRTQIESACMWGRAKGRHIIDALVKDGYGAIGSDANMVLVYTPLAFYAAMAQRYGPERAAGMVSLTDRLPIEWSVWVPKHQRDVAREYGARLRQSSAVVEPVEVNVDYPRTPLLARWALTEVPAVLTAYFRHGDFALDASTELTLLRPSDARGNLTFIVEFGRIS